MSLGKGTLQETVKSPIRRYLTTYVPASVSCKDDLKALRLFRLSSLLVICCHDLQISAIRSAHLIACHGPSHLPSLVGLNRPIRHPEGNLQTLLGVAVIRLSPSRIIIGSVFLPLSPCSWLYRQRIHCGFLKVDHSESRSADSITSSLNTHAQSWHPPVIRTPPHLTRGMTEVQRLGVRHHYS